ncbi:hypothetical protein [Pseudochrobactrum sp. B5]|uniref:hypothetical protein n=1 Tax=Pseudochrobactrum sp. B5 TaxID=1289478 RepID=UPI0009515026|nr:hypothetical protein [Pseudochrobactrum sp. B5]
MVDIPYHTHQFDIPTASEGEIRTGVEAGKAITPDRLFPVLADKADKSTTLAGYGIVDAATKEQGQKADTAVQPAQVSAVGFSGRYDDLLNKPSLGSASGLNVGTTAGTVAAGDDARIVNAAQQSITVTAGAGLSGGGTLAANIALALSSTSLASLALADTAVQPSDLGALATKSKVATADIDASGSTAGGALLTRGGVWVDPSGGGDMFRATYDPNNKAADAFSMGSMVETTAAKVMTAAERTKLAGVATGATANTGTVTSVGVAVPAGLSATGAITTSGTITISYATGYQGYTTAEANKLAGIPADADKTPALAAVATTGSYNDLSNKPTIPAAQVQTDWNASSGVSSIANKPATFPPSAHTHTPSEVGLGNVANKTEAQMVATGAIADSLDGKMTGDTCEIGGFISQNAQSPYMRHKTSNEVVRLLRYDQPANKSYSVNGMQLRAGRQQVTFNASGHATVNFTPFPNTLTSVVITSAEFTTAASYGVQPINEGAFNLYSNSPSQTKWISWIATGG